MKRGSPNIIAPQVLVLAQGKGGVGKSALATSLAGHYAQCGLKTAIIDADPQGTVSKLYDPFGPMQKIAVLAAPDADAVGAAIERLKAKHDVVLVDTAGFQNRTTILTLVAADFVLVPSKPARDNITEALAMLDQTREVAKLPERKGRPLPAAIVLTQVKRNTVIARTTRKTLRKNRVPLLDAEMLDRIFYAEWPGIAPCFGEPTGGATSDIAAIAREIGKMLHAAEIKAA